MRVTWQACDKYTKSLSKGLCPLEFLVISNILKILPAHFTRQTCLGLKLISSASSLNQFSTADPVSTCLEPESNVTEDGTSEEFGMMLDILLTTPDNVLTKA